MYSFPTQQLNDNINVEFIEEKYSYSHKSQVRVVELTSCKRKVRLPTIGLIIGPTLP